MMDALPLPQCPDAERALLGAILLNNDKLQTANNLQPSDFFDARHQKIFATIRSMLSRGQTVDLVGLGAVLSERDLETVGGAAYLSSLLDGIPRVNAAAEWARIVAEKSKLRNLAHAGEKMREAALAGDAQGALDQVRAAANLFRAAHGSGVAGWAGAEEMRAFLGAGDDGAEFLDQEKRLLARGSVTGIFSPRGLGKSIYVSWLTLRLALKGLRVILLDRDNPRHTVRSRLKSLGAHGGIPGVSILSREKCPPLTRTRDWESFPYADFDAVILDSLDSATEGAGEQDSSKPSQAFASLLDIARRENGPAVLILGNCVKTGKHSRGSGVIEDRCDVVFEVRDATGFQPSGSKPWFAELPPADAGSWASRSSRRKQRTVFRLAFTASKFRIGEEPEPFVVELDLSSEPWTVRDVTDDLDQDGAAARKERIQRQQDRLSKAADALATEIERRASVGQPAMLKDRDAIPFLTQRGLKRAEARDLLTGPGQPWVIAPVEGKKGHPAALLPAGKNVVGGGNEPVVEPAKTQGNGGDDSRRALPERAAEIPSSKPQSFCGDAKPPISAEPSLLPPRAGVVEGEL